MSTSYPLLNSYLTLTCPLHLLRKVLTLCVLLFVFGSLNVWGETATLQISSGVTANGDLTDNQSNTWSVSSDGDYSSNNSYIQCGTNNKSVSYIRLTTSAYGSYNISKIQVWGTSKANSNVTAKVFIGSTKIGESESAYSSQNAGSGGTELSVTNTNGIKGDITIEISRPSSAKGAIYFNKLIVTYEEDDDPGTGETAVKNVPIF